MSITKLSPNWACQMGPIHCPKFFLSGQPIRPIAAQTRARKDSKEGLSEWITHNESINCSNLQSLLNKLVDTIIFTATRYTRSKTINTHRVTRLYIHSYLRYNLYVKRPYHPYEPRKESVHCHSRTKIQLYIFVLSS